MGKMRTSEEQKRLAHLQCTLAMICWSAAGTLLAGRDNSRCSGVSTSAPHEKETRLGGACASTEFCTLVWV